MVGDETERAERLRKLLHDAPRAPNRESLDAWASAVGAALPRPVTITLAGELGAGKTTLVRALARGIGVADLHAVTSPTFALMQEYGAPDGPVVHADLYRLKSDAELEALGWDEVVATAPVLVIEWPERAEASLQEPVIAVDLRHDPEHADRRVMRVRTRGFDSSPR